MQTEEKDSAFDQNTMRYISEAYKNILMDKGVEDVIGSFIFHKHSLSLR
jgi:hypothetical protein